MGTVQDATLKLPIRHFAIRTSYFSLFTIGTSPAFAMIWIHRPQSHRLTVPPSHRLTVVQSYRPTVYSTIPLSRWSRFKVLNVLSMLRKSNAPPIANQIVNTIDRTKKAHIQMAQIDNHISSGMPTVKW